MMRVKKKHRKHRAKYGRLLVLGLFLWLRIMDLAVVRFLYPHLSVGYQQNLKVFLVAMGLWATGLLAAVWFRQLWAKYLLVVSMVLVVIGALSSLPSLMDSGDSHYKLTLSMAMLGIYLPPILLLVASQHIHKLTEPKGMQYIPE
jgi:hypothetical protein